jgi:hypothetical protein
MRDQRAAQGTPTDPASDEVTGSVRNSPEAPVRRIALDPDLGARNRLTKGVRDLTGRFECRVARSKKERAEAGSDQLFKSHRVRLTLISAADRTTSPVPSRSFVSPHVGALRSEKTPSVGDVAPRDDVTPMSPRHVPEF